MSDSHRSYHLRAPLRQESSRMLWSGESELWRLQVHEASENQWFCVMCSVFFFQTALAFLQHHVVSDHHDKLSATEDGLFEIPWQRWKRGTLCLGLLGQFVLWSCLTFQDPSCSQGPNLSAFCLSMPSMLQGFTNAQRTCRSMVFV